MNKSMKKSSAPDDLSKVTTYQAGIIQAVTNRQLQKICDDFLAQYGITKMHWLIIGTILDEGQAGIRLTDLTKRLDTNRSYLTNTLNLLESKGIVERAHGEEDNRSKFVFLNEDFARKCTTIEKGLREKLRQSIYAQVDPQEFRTYMKVLYQLAGNDKKSS